MKFIKLTHEIHQIIAKLNLTKKEEIVVFHLMFSDTFGDKTLKFTSLELLEELLNEGYQLSLTSVRRAIKKIKASPLFEVVTTKYHRIRILWGKQFLDTDTIASKEINSNTIASEEIKDNKTSPKAQQAEEAKKIIKKTTEKVAEKEEQPEVTRFQAGGKEEVKEMPCEVKNKLKGALNGIKSGKSINKENSSNSLVFVQAGTQEQRSTDEGDKNDKTQSHSSTSKENRQEEIKPSLNCPNLEPYQEELRLYGIHFYSRQNGKLEISKEIRPALSLADKLGKEECTNILKTFISWIKTAKNVKSPYGALVSALKQKWTKQD